MNEEDLHCTEETRWLNLTVLCGLSVEAGLSELREEALSKSTKGTDVTFIVSTEQVEDCLGVAYNVGVKYQRQETTRERQIRLYSIEQEEFNQLQKDKREYQRLKLKFEGETTNE